jgi:crotonobetainyl-CoA:carnitine CoA-transferase CaiB-like acyl-CoA transferase
MSGSGNGKSHGPLAGVRVLEFGQIAAGPFAGSLLADLGADVVKVENPAGGDGMRGWPPLSSTDGGPAFSENFASVNRNKRSIAVDLKDAASLTQLKALCAVADVVPSASVLFSASPSPAPGRRSSAASSTHKSSTASRQCA